MSMLVASAFVFGHVAVRASASRVLRRGRRFLLVLAATLWLATGWTAVSWAVLDTTAPMEGLGRALVLAAVLIAAQPLLRDVFALLNLVLSGRVELHDHIRLAGEDPLEGRVVSLGLRNVVIETAESARVTIPNRALDRRALHRIARASDRTGVPVELSLQLRLEEDLEVQRAQLLEAAMLSPFGSPGRLVEVDVVADVRGVVELRLRGWVADRGQSDRYRGDVLQRLRAGTPRSDSGG